MPAIFRGDDNAEPGDEKESRPGSRRVPKNIPYLVDNLWAWARPDAYADRRSSAYGYQNRKQAEEHGEVYRVRFQGKHIICQLQGCTDAKYHPDIPRLKKKVRELLGGYDWSNQPIGEKAPAGRLYIPALSVDEVQSALEKAGLSRSEHASLRDAVKFWEDVEIVTGDEFPNTAGEIFFEYPDGYVLESVDA
jgi:hypothetical protein